MFEVDTFIQNMLINTASVLLPVILYQKIIADGETSNQEWMEKIWLATLGTIAGLLCITYSLTPVNGIFLDLRPVLFLIIFYYGGFLVGGFVLLLTLAYRLYLGEPSIYILTFIGFLVICVLVSYKRFRDGSIYTKYLTAGIIILSFCIGVSLYIHLVYTSADQMLLNSLLFVIYMFTSTLTMLASIYLIESGYAQRQMRIELQRADNLHTVGRIAASMAHEIRNPLTVVRGFIQMMGRVSDEEKRQYYSQVALQELERAGEIINEYLSFAKSNHGQVESINLTRTVNQTIEMMYSLAVSSGVRIESELDDSITLMADSKKLKQVLLNIIKNGIEAMKDGGVLKVTTRTQDDKAIIDIIDFGIGMKTEEVKRLGTSFYSNKERGTGLGLMVCFQLIKAMNGNLQIESEIGKGSRFSIILPLGEEVEKQGP